MRKHLKIYKKGPSIIPHLSTIVAIAHFIDFIKYKNQKGLSKKKYEPVWPSQLLRK